LSKAPFLTSSALHNSWECSKAGQENTGSINGIVVDAQGKTVTGAWVTIICGNRPLGGRIPGALSDERGHFEVDSLELGRRGVSACKEDDDVACPPFFIVAHSIQVTLTAKVPFRTVKIHLGDKGSVITGMVKDAISRKPLAASFTLRPLRFPDRPMSMSSPAAFRIFIVPSTDYGFEVSAPGYKNWSFAEQYNPSRPLRLAPGAHLNLDVQLEPIASSGFAQSTPKITALYDRLIQPSETNAAAPEILEMAKNDSTARDFLAGKLPSLIVDRLPPHDARNGSPGWLNAVRLTGQLKIVEAIPALTQALSRPEICGGYELTDVESLPWEHRRVLTMMLLEELWQT
jgi:hypothetical protein